MLGVVDDDADALCGIHGGAAADGDKAVCAGLLVGFNTGLDVFDGGVGLNLVIYLISDAGIVQHLEHLGGYIELHKALIGYYQHLLEASVFHLIGDNADCACSKIRGLIKNESVYHNVPFRSTRTGRFR